MARTENPMAKIVGQKIRLERERQKLTQKQLADGIKATSATINRIENGIHYPSSNNLAAIARFLKKPKEFFTEQITSPALPSGNTIKLEDYQNALQEIGSLKSEIEHAKQKLAGLEQEFTARKDLGIASFGYYVLTHTMLILESFYTPEEIDALDWHTIIDSLDMEYDTFMNQWKAQDIKKAFRKKR